MSAAEDAVMALKNECKRLLVLLPTKVQAAAAVGPLLGGWRPPGLL